MTKGIKKSFWINILMYCLLIGYFEKLTWYAYFSCIYMYVSYYALRFIIYSQRIVLKTMQYYNTIGKYLL